MHFDGSEANFALSEALLEQNGAAQKSVFFLFLAQPLIFLNNSCLILLSDGASFAPCEAFLEQFRLYSWIF